MPRNLLHQRRHQPVQILLRDGDGMPQLQHQAAVDSVLAGCAPMNEACGVGIPLRYQRRELLHQRNSQIAGLRRSLRQRGAVY
ncbi:hypothetical protein D3C80_1670870 [compost metagenome]